MSEGREWALRSICADCLQSDTGKAVLSGAVGVATIRTSPVERCILCGWPFADQVDDAGPADRRPME